MKLLFGYHLYLFITKKELSAKKLAMLKKGKAHLRRNPHKPEPVDPRQIPLIPETERSGHDSV